jgi:hypothetical protein
MARGWESKSVEEQQSLHQLSPEKPKRSAEELRRDAARQSLALQRAQVLERMKQSQNPRYLDLLRHQLEDLDRELRTLSA